jgi:copper chaperone CopZ
MDHFDHVRIPIHGLSCASSEARSIERALVALDGVAGAYLNPVTGAVDVSFDGAAIDIHALAHAITRAGYRPGGPIDASDPR